MPIISVVWTSQEVAECLAELPDSPPRQPTYSQEELMRAIQQCRSVADKLEEMVHQHEVVNPAPKPQPAVVPLPPVVTKSEPPATALVRGKTVEEVALSLKDETNWDLVLDPTEWVDPISLGDPDHNPVNRQDVSGQRDLLKAIFRWIEANTSSSVEGVMAQCLRFCSVCTGVDLTNGIKVSSGLSKLESMEDTPLWTPVFELSCYYLTHAYSFLRWGQWKSHHYWDASPIPTKTKEASAIKWTGRGTWPLSKDATSMEEPATPADPLALLGTLAPTESENSIQEAPIPEQPTELPVTGYLWGWPYGRNYQVGICTDNESVAATLSFNGEQPYLYTVHTGHGIPPADRVGKIGEVTLTPPLSGPTVDKLLLAALQSQAAKKGVSLRQLLNT